MKKNKIKTGLIVGSSGIGQVHLREFNDFGIKKIGLYGKRFDKDRIKKIKIKDLNFKNFYNLENIQEIRKFKPKVISICSPTNVHLKHIYKFRRICKNLIVEKPLIWQSNCDNLKKTKNILNYKNKIFTNLPMISLANQLMQKQKISKIKQFNFNYFTNGKNTYNDIAVDLLPHALSLFFKLKKNLFKHLDILEVNREKLKWSCKLNIDDCNCVFSFKQGIKKKGSQLSFKINDDFYLRKQVKVGNNYVTKLIKNKKKIIKLKNPMTDYLQHILENFNSKLSLKKNNQITIMSVKVSENLINFK